MRRPLARSTPGSPAGCTIWAGCWARRGKRRKGLRCLGAALLWRKENSVPSTRSFRRCWPSTPCSWRTPAAAAEAENAHRRCLALHLRLLGGEQVETALAQANLAAFLVSRGAAEEAVPLLTSALGSLARQRGTFRGAHPHLRSVTRIYAAALADLKKTAEEVEAALKPWQTVAPKRERSRFLDEEAAI